MYVLRKYSNFVLTNEQDETYFKSDRTEDSHNALGLFQIDKDFDFVHPGAGNFLFNKWPMLEERLLQYGEKVSSLKHIALTLRSFSIDLTCCGKFAVLVFLLRK